MISLTDVFQGLIYEASAPERTVERSKPRNEENLQMVADIEAPSTSTARNTVRETAGSFCVANVGGSHFRSFCFSFVSWMLEADIFCVLARMTRCTQVL